MPRLTSAGVFRCPGGSGNGRRRAGLVDEEAKDLMRCCCMGGERGTPCLGLGPRREEPLGGDDVERH